MAAIFTPGTLRALIASRTQAARRSGALEPIATDVEYIADAGVEFVVRVVSSLAKKRRAQRRLRDDPYLPFDAALLVADVSDTHVCLLNKFNVMPEHALIVTREFEAQESLLSPCDFEALERCMHEFPSLGFYNSGAAAGASQRHKHLQLVPLPLSERRAIPLEPLIVSNELPFAHAFARSDALPETYGELMHRCGLEEGQPYNLLVTSEWMLVVPRTREHSDGISLNALAFAGSLFVKTREELEHLKAMGAMQALMSVTRQRS